jgi:hypothetical protein
MELAVLSTVAPLLADVGSALILISFSMQKNDGINAIGAVLSFFCTAMQCIDVSLVANAWLSAPTKEPSNGTNHTLSSVHDVVTVIISLIGHSELTIQRLACASMSSLLQSCSEGAKCTRSSATAAQTFPERTELCDALVDAAMQMTHVLFNNIILSKSSTSFGGGFAIADASCRTLKCLVQLERVHSPSICSMVDSNWCPDVIDALVYSSTGTLCSSHLWFVTTVLENKRKGEGVGSAASECVSPEAVMQLLTDADKAVAVGSVSRQSITLLTVELQASALIPPELDIVSLNPTHNTASCHMITMQRDVAFDSSFRLVDNAILVGSSALSTVFSMT